MFRKATLSLLPILLCACLLFTLGLANLSEIGAEGAGFFGGIGALVLYLVTLIVR